MKTTDKHKTETHKKTTDKHIKQKLRRNISLSSNSDSTRAHEPTQYLSATTIALTCPISRDHISELNHGINHSAVTASSDCQMACHFESRFSDYSHRTSRYSNSDTLHKLRSRFLLGQTFQKSENEPRHEPKDILK